MGAREGRGADLGANYSRGNDLMVITTVKSSVQILAASSACSDQTAAAKDYLIEHLVYS